jgi:regulator of sigma E protease
MNGLIMAAQLITALSLLVFIHELGHYLAARAFGIKVDKFYIFFDWGFSLYKKKIGDTEFGIGWLPLGGYCKISGMIDESLDTEQLKSEPKEWEFRSKPAWQRFIVMIAGVVMNVIVGIIIFTAVNLIYVKEYVPIDNVKEGIYAYKYGRFLGFETGDKIVAVNGKKIDRMQDAIMSNAIFGGTITVERNGTLIDIETPDTVYRYIQSGGLFIGFENYQFQVDSVIKESNADKAGILQGDKFLSINQIPVGSYGGFREMLKNNTNDTVELKIERNNGIVELKISVDSSGRLGFWSNLPKYETEKYTFFKAMKYGNKDAFAAVIANIKGFKLLFTGQEKIRNLSGPIGIAKVYGADWNWVRFWSITGMISMVLAFINILPIPGLDGGHAFFTLIEAVTRRKLPDRFMEIVQYIGMAILLALIVFILGNDIINLFR